MQIYDSGQLTKKISIFAYQNITDTDGFDRQELVAIYNNISAQIIPMRGIEALEYEKYYNTLPLKIIIRYRDNINNECIIKYRNSEYNIISIINENMSNEALLIYAVEKSRGVSNGTY